MTQPQRWSINGRFLAQTQTGVQRYAREMTLAIDARLAADDALHRHLAFDLCLPADAADALPLGAIGIRRSPVGRGYAWEQMVLPAMARGGLLSFANLGPLAHPRQIVCLHDANVALEPTSYTRTFRLAYRSLLPRLARRARIVTTVSQFSSEMLQSFAITGGRASVVPNGHEHALRWDAAASRFSAPGALPRPYVFMLGSRAKHKQLDLMLGLAPALDALGLDLVVSGGRSSTFAAIDVASAPNVRFLGFVSDDDLAALFANALCFAFPSRTEGFGLPLLEAMVHGAPIVASRCASMPEVCAEAALYAPPDDPHAWLAQIRRLAADPDLAANLRAKGFARYLVFSWAEGAQRYLDIARTLVRPQRGRTPTGVPSLGRSPS